MCPGKSERSARVLPGWSGSQVVEDVSQAGEEEEESQEEYPTTSSVPV